LAQQAAKGPLLVVAAVAALVVKRDSSLTLHRMERG
jgi:hypothetical protein